MSLRISLESIFAKALISWFIDNLIWFCTVDFFETTIFFFDFCESRETCTIFVNSFIFIDATCLITNTINLNKIGSWTSTFIFTDKVSQIWFTWCSYAWTIRYLIELGLGTIASFINFIDTLFTIMTKTLVLSVTLETLTLGSIHEPIYIAFFFTIETYKHIIIFALAFSRRIIDHLCSITL